MSEAVVATMEAGPQSESPVAEEQLCDEIGQMSVNPKILLAELVLQCPPNEHPEAIHGTPDKGTISGK
jgi:hypothetical protein